MATTPIKPEIDTDAEAARQLPPWPVAQNIFSASSLETALFNQREQRPSGADALPALLAFSAMHQQVRQRRALASRLNGFDTIARSGECEPQEQFVLDEVLQLVAERAIAITGA